MRGLRCVVGRLLFLQFELYSWQIEGTEGVVIFCCYGFYCSFSKWVPALAYYNSYDSTIKELKAPAVAFNTRLIMVVNDQEVYVSKFVDFDVSITDFGMGQIPASRLLDEE